MTTPVVNATNSINPGPGPRTAPGPSTPAAVNNLVSTSTPKSHHTPGGHGSFASPAHRGTPRSFGTPSKAGMAAFGGKTVGGGHGVGGKTTSMNTDGSVATGGSGPVAHATPMFTFGASPALNFTSPNASGAGSTNIDALTGFSNPGGSFNGMDGGTGMGISLSSLGINMMMGPTLSTTGSTVGKTDDVERKRRLEDVLEKIGKRPGRISREGVERLGRKCGLDTQMGEVDDLAMAGKNILVDFEFASNHSQNIKNVAVNLATASDAVTENTAKAAKILQEDLTPPTGTSTMSATLEKFAANLERLACMDRLSIPGASCFDAVYGVYTSLKRLYDHEKESAEKLFGSNVGQKAEMEVMCKKSGLPRMHVGKRVGLALGYWTDRHLIENPTHKARASEEKDVHMGGTDNFGNHEEENAFLNLVIECEPLPPTLYPTIAITSDWVSERVEKPVDEVDITMNGTDAVMAGSKPLIEWLDPPPPILPTLDANALSADGTVNISSTGQPQARFVARLEPPVILPLHISAQVYSSIGVDISHDAVSPSTLPGLALPQHFPSATSVDQLPKYLSTKRSMVDKNDKTREYQLSLFPTRLELARLVDSVPFAHPKQIIAMLPVFRQYSFITRVLQNTFSSNIATTSNTKPAERISQNGTRVWPSNGAIKTRRMQGENAKLEAELTTLLDAVHASKEDDRSLDVALSITPVPQMTVIFLGSRGPKRVTLNILLNAEVEIVEQDVVLYGTTNNPDHGTEGQDELIRRDDEGKRVREVMARALTVCEDLVVWTEWMQVKFLDSR